MQCPCGNPDYHTCCEPFHLGTTRPPTAEALMRSRYSAYALAKIDYLWATHHPAKRPATPEPLRQWAEATTFTQLEILAHSQGGPTDKIGKVTFKAHYITQGQQDTLQETSRFKRYQGHWVYWDGDIS